MKGNFIFLYVTLCAICVCATSCISSRSTSPNGQLVLQPNKQGTSFNLTYKDVDSVIAVLQIPAIGVQTKQGRGKDLQLKHISKVRKHTDDYMMLTGKRRHCHNEAHEYTYTYMDSLGKDVRLMFRLYNDGLAFRYEIDDMECDLVTDEFTTYRIEDGRCRWMQKFELGYEEFYTPRTTPDNKLTHWIYPALVEHTPNVYTLITEANILKGHAASSLKNEAMIHDYKISLANNEGACISGNWVSPWRVVMVGSLQEVVSSTLVTDVSEANKIEDAAEWVKPGTASWVYWAYNRGSRDYQIVSRYIDMANKLKLPYVLIDWEWDIMSNGGTIKDAIKKADSLGIRTLVWYNSSTAWTEGAGGPLYRLNKPEDREREFAWLAKMGVAGVKIDFFDGDTRATMDYCIDLLEAAARHHLLVNFHGATLPRGWQRTYPNLITTEAVYGAEWYNNTHRFTNRAATHNATLPFTRNVVGSMDYTPCAFSDSQHPHITTHAHEVALTILFESGVQHLADRPESYYAQPTEVQSFLSNLPTVWNETKLLSGYPGKWVTMARRDENDWYVAMINGMDSAQNIKIDWSFLGDYTYDITTFGDVIDQPRAWDIKQYNKLRSKSLPTSIMLQPRGGFVAVCRQK